MDYLVHHNANWVLDFSFRATGNGAYPSTQTLHLTIDLHTGDRLTAPAAFLPSRLNALRATVGSRVHRSWKQALARHPDVVGGQPEPNVTMKDIDNFIVKADGVVFLFDYGFPHAIAAATPVSEFPIPIQELRPFIRTPGPLSWML